MTDSKDTDSIGADSVFYSFRRCPYAMRARMALKVSGANPQLRDITLKDKPQEMLEASPKGTVPVLVCPDGRVIDQSLEIMRYALSLNDPQNWMKNAEGAEALIAQNDGAFKAALDRYKYPVRFADEAAQYGDDEDDNNARGLDALKALAFAECKDFFNQLNAVLRQQAFLAGDHIGLADIAIFPFIRQAAFVDRSAFDALPFSFLQDWFEKIINSSLFLSIMPAVSPWKNGQKPILFQDVMIASCANCPA